MQALPHLTDCCGQVWTVSHIFPYTNPGGTLWSHSAMSFSEETMAGLLWLTSHRLDGAAYGYCCLRGFPLPTEFRPLLLSHCYCVSGCGLLLPLTVSLASRPAHPSLPSSTRSCGLIHISTESLADIELYNNANLIRLIALLKKLTLICETQMSPVRDEI